MTWRRRTFWEPDNVDPGQLPLAIVCPPRHWRRVHAEIDAENPPYPVVLFRPLHRCAGWELRGYEFRYLGFEDYSRRVQEWEVMELDPRVVRPGPVDQSQLTIVDDLPAPGPATEAMRERMSEWVGQVLHHEARRLEDLVWQEPSGILSAIDTSNVAESSDDELTLETLQEAMRELREQAYPREDEIPEWQVQIVQAMMEGRTLIVSRGRGHGLRQLLEWLTESELAGNARIFELDIVPENQVMIGDGPDDDIVMASWFAEQGAGERIRELYANTPPESPFGRMLQRQQVPDEITDADRERWANELETTPMPDVGQDAGGALSSDELLEAIGEAVTEWKDVRDE